MPAAHQTTGEGKTGAVVVCTRQVTGRKKLVGGTCGRKASAQWFRMHEAKMEERTESETYRKRQATKRKSDEVSRSQQQSVG